MGRDRAHRRGRRRRLRRRGVPDGRGHPCRAPGEGRRLPEGPAARRTTRGLHRDVPRRPPGQHTGPFLPVGSRRLPGRRVQPGDGPGGRGERPRQHPAARRHPRPRYGPGGERAPARRTAHRSQGDTRARRVRAPGLGRDGGRVSARVRRRGGVHDGPAARFGATPRVAADRPAAARCRNLGRLRLPLPRDHRHRRLQTLRPPGTGPPRRGTPRSVRRRGLPGEYRRCPRRRPRPAHTHR